MNSTPDISEHWCRQGFFLGVELDNNDKRNKRKIKEIEKLENFKRNFQRKNQKWKTQGKTFTIYL